MKGVITQNVIFYSINQAEKECKHSLPLNIKIRKYSSELLKEPDPMELNKHMNEQRGILVLNHCCGKYAGKKSDL
jgi:hypothetical protein